MKIRIKKKKPLEEMSSMGGGAVQGYAGSPLATKEEKDTPPSRSEEHTLIKLSQEKRSMLVMLSDLDTKD